MKRKCIDNVDVKPIRYIDGITPYDANFLTVIEKKEKKVYLHYLNKMIDEEKETIIHYLNRAYLYHLQGEDAKAIADFDRVISAGFDKKLETHLSPSHIYYFRAASKFNLQQYKEALDDCNRAIELNPNEADNYCLRAQVYEELDMRLAVDDYDRALKLNPADVKAYYNRGFMHSARGDLDLAEADYRKAIEIDPKNVQSYHYLGSLFFEKENDLNAIESFGKSIEYFKETKSNLFNLALSYKERGVVYACLDNWEKAVQDFAKASSLKPDLDGLYHDYGNACDWMNDHDKAIICYTKAIELGDKPLEACMHRASSYCVQGKYINEIADYIWILKMEPNPKEPNRVKAERNLKEALDTKIKTLQQLFLDIKTLAPAQARLVLNEALNPDTFIGQWAFERMPVCLTLKEEMKVYYENLRNNEDVFKVARAASTLFFLRERPAAKQHPLFSLPAELIKKIASQTADNLAPEDAMEIANQHFCKPA